MELYHITEHSITQYKKTDYYWFQTMFFPQFGTKLNNDVNFYWNTIRDSILGKNKTSNLKICKTKDTKYTAFRIDFDNYLIFTEGKDKKEDVLIPLVHDIFYPFIDKEYFYEVTPDKIKQTIVRFPFKDKDKTIIRNLIPETIYKFKDINNDIEYLSCLKTLHYLSKSTNKNFINSVKNLSKHEGNYTNWYHILKTEPNKITIHTNDNKVSEDNLKHVFGENYFRVINNSDKGKLENRLSSKLQEIKQPFTGRRATLPKPFDYINTYNIQNYLIDDDLCLCIEYDRYNNSIYTIWLYKESKEVWYKEYKSLQSFYTILDQFNSLQDFYEDIKKYNRFSEGHLRQGPWGDAYFCKYGPNGDYDRKEYLV